MKTGYIIAIVILLVVTGIVVLFYAFPESVEDINQDRDSAQPQDSAIIEATIISLDKKDDCPIKEEVCSVDTNPNDRGTIKIDKIENYVIDGNAEYEPLNIGETKSTSFKYSVRPAKVRCMNLDQLGSSENVLFSELISNSQKYNGKRVCTEGVHVSAFESDAIGESTYQEGEAMYLTEPTIWNEGANIKSKQDCFETDTIPSAEFCKVRICGIFEYGGAYGHVGGYQYQITDDAGELIAVGERGEDTGIGKSIPREGGYFIYKVSSYEESCPGEIVLPGLKVGDKIRAEITYLGFISMGEYEIDTGVGCNLITGEGCDGDSTSSCDEGFVFSQKDCTCVLDSFGCNGLDKESCEQNQNCFSFSRSGRCSSPASEIYLEHQCLPK